MIQTFQCLLALRFFEKYLALGFYFLFFVILFEIFSIFLKWWYPAENIIIKLANNLYSLLEASTCVPLIEHYTIIWLANICLNYTYNSLQIEKVEGNTYFSSCWVLMLPGSLFMLFYNKQSFSRGAIEYHCPMVPFISVIVFIELLISEIFRGIVEVCHSKRKFISLSDFMIKFDKLSLKQKTATWRRRMTNGLNFIIAIENRESLNISKWRILCICTCPIIILLNAKVVMWCTKCNLLFLNV